MRLYERYITLTSDEVSKQKYYDEVLDILEKSYRSIGGIQSNSLSNLMEPDMMWKLVRRGDKITAVTISKLIRGTRKVVLAGTDLTSQGKNDLYSIIKEDISRSERRSWVEVSDAMEHIYVNKQGATMIPDDLAAEVMSVLGKRITPTGDGYHYTRKLGPNKEEHTKVIVGDAEQLRSFVDAMKSAQLSECLSRDVLLAKKLLESKGFLVSRK